MLTHGWNDPARYGRTHAGYTLRGGRGIDGFAPHVRLARPAEVYDQGGVGSCVAQALAFAVEVATMRQTLVAERPDRTALYHRARRSIGTVSEDSGAIIADGIQVLRAGYEPELIAPSTQWDDSYTAVPADPGVDAPRVVNAEPLAHDVLTAMWELLCGHPVVVGLRITEQWERPGEVIAAPSGAVVGGHAVCLVGYQREGDRVQFRCRNSWGAGFGDGGEVWLDAAWLGLGHAGELHAIRAIRRAP